MRDQIIKHIKEPKVLYVMWKEHHVANLFGDRFEYLNELPEGFVGFPAFSLSKKIHTGNVLSIFLSRCPDKKRASYHKYLRNFGLSVEDKISDFALLGYTGAYLPNNPFYLINPFLDIEPPFEFIMKLSNIREYLPSIKLWGEKKYKIEVAPYALCETNYAFIKVMI